eukprot:4975258-Prorocentrum_lima.AAC.1
MGSNAPGAPDDGYVETSVVQCSPDSDQITIKEVAPPQEEAAPQEAAPEEAAPQEAVFQQEAAPQEA